MDTPVALPGLRQRKCADLLLDIAVLLMSSGAHTERVNRNLHRITKALGYEQEILFSLAGITLTLSDPCDTGAHYTVFRRIKSYGVHLGIVSGVSRMSWKLCLEGMTIAELRTEVERLKSLPHYPKPVIITMIALAGMAFCYLAGGELLAVLLAGVATAAGFLVRSRFLSSGYNLPLSICAASFTSSGISGLGIVFHLGISPEIAVATSVLFLIPGVPMINAVIDLLQGHTVTGQGRAMQVTVMAFAIALGIVLSSALLGIGKL
ncbi:threonine/serine exporter family protein [Endozoicomonas sp. Mp262]|uniref:threonine/serine ThrE exporter family protein n=1 Tax=Endozoicomonas sp. Mp262 TaxID=2919499 RepID=UPI0021DB1F9A